jgi:hypothetical protein
MERVLTPEEEGFFLEALRRSTKVLAQKVIVMNGDPADKPAEPAPAPVETPPAEPPPPAEKPADPKPAPAA